MAATVPHDTREIFLDIDSYQTLDNYLAAQFSRPASAPKTFHTDVPLILVGPVKSGKSTLMRVIAGHLTHRYHERFKADPSAFRPLLLTHSFPLNTHPAHAPGILLDVLRPAAAEFGVQLPILPAATSLKMQTNVIKDAYRMISRAAWKRNMHIWFLWEELHVRR